MYAVSLSLHLHSLDEINGERNKVLKLRESLVIDVAYKLVDHTFFEWHESRAVTMAWRSKPISLSMSRIRLFASTMSMYSGSVSTAPITAMHIVSIVATNYMHTIPSCRTSVPYSMIFSIIDLYCR